MTFVNIQEAKKNLSNLINQVLKGEEIIIMRRDLPLIKLTPYIPEPDVSEKDIPETGCRKSGQLNGLIKISDDFNAPLSKEILKNWYEK